MSYLLSFLAFVIALAGVKGGTWDPKAVGVRKINFIGWVVIVSSLAVLVFSLMQEYRKNLLDEQVMRYPYKRFMDALEVSLGPFNVVYSEAGGVLAYHENPFAILDRKDAAGVISKFDFERTQEGANIWSSDFSGNYASYTCQELSDAVDLMESTLVSNLAVLDREVVVLVQEFKQSGYVREFLINKCDYYVGVRRDGNMVRVYPPKLTEDKVKVTFDSIISIRRHLMRVLGGSA
ncbi:hypothetical protein [Pseudomonas chlororaphis]|uniref:hypothetical protein n=1 Tax=Pseudomonas chlororaphis TaxID=587753 RepID=UPI002D771A6D|nr:hypothetical protein [Pseudomonas chlororaphis]